MTQSGRRPLPPAVLFGAPRRILCRSTVLSWGQPWRSDTNNMLRIFGDRQSLLAALSCHWSYELIQLD
ncbi:MAG: hypothetical protein ACO3LI_08805, partial [Vulcanococcus sp.]